MSAFLKICVAIGSALHWLTGWLVHPKKGGCYEMTTEDFFNTVDKNEKE